MYYLGSVLSDCSEDVQEVVAVPLLRKSVHLVERFDILVSCSGVHCTLKDVQTHSHLSQYHGACSVSLDDNEWKDHANAFEAVAALLCGNLSALDEHLEVLQQLFAASVSKLSNQVFTACSPRSSGNCPPQFC